MPRTKPTKKLGVYGKYDLKLDQSIDLYNESKLQNQYYIKEPYWDIARDGIEANANQNERESTEMLRLQEDMRQQLKVERVTNENRVKDLTRMGKDMRERFISVNDFIRDCEDKEALAQQKIEIESEGHRKIQLELSTIDESMGVLEKFLKTLTATASEFEPYERVIEQVVDESELYKNVKDLMDRCDALMIAQVEIVKMEEEKIKDIEEMRQKMVQATNDAALTIMGLNNELSELENAYNISKAEAIKWGRVMVATKDCIAEKETLTFRMSDQIRQLYLLLCNRNGTAPEFRLEQYEEQLDVIKSDMEFFTEVVAYSNKMMAAELKSTNVTPRSCVTSNQKTGRGKKV